MNRTHLFDFLVDTLSHHGYSIFYHVGEIAVVDIPIKHIPDSHRPTVRLNHRWPAPICEPSLAFGKSNLFFVYVSAFSLDMCGDLPLD